MLIFLPIGTRVIYLILRLIPVEIFLIHFNGLFSICQDRGILISMISTLCLAWIIIIRISQVCLIPIPMSYPTSIFFILRSKNLQQKYPTTASLRSLFWEKQCHLCCSRGSMKIYLRREVIQTQEQPSHEVTVKFK